MQRMQRFCLTLLILACCFGCDQVSKRVAQEKLQYQRPQSFLGNTFRLQYAENTGAFLSLGSSLSKTTRMVLFTALSGGLLVALLLYILLNKELDRNHTFALSLILGGGFSNLYDRIFNDGRVIDFMNMGIGSLRTGIFNWADVVIMVGMGLIILLNFGSRKSSRGMNHSSGDSPEDLPGTS
ncbi:MAG: signal peptidase II [Caldithrix sp.]|nr:MAG: signal peptidase II [Caldithrix sp.]